MTKAQKDWIDNASYAELFRKWRFAPLGDPMFQGDTGEYFAKVLRERKAQVGDAEHVAASKALGWEKS